MFVKGVLNGELTGERIFFQPVRVQPHGLEDFVGHVNGPMGMRSFLRTAEYMEQAIIEFEIWVSKKRMSSAKELTEDDLFELLVFGQECGMGSCRTYESGKYLVLNFEALT